MGFLYFLIKDYLYCNMDIVYIIRYNYYNKYKGAICL